MTEKPLLPEEQFAFALADHVGVQKPYCIIRRTDKEILSPRSFNMEYNRVVNNIGGLKGYKDDAASYAIASPALDVVRTICYRPDSGSIIDRKFNMWTDPGIEPLKGKPEIFLDHIRYLIPNESERRLLVSWLAWIVQHPDRKVQYAVLIVGRGGTGKSWLGYLMERIFGADNVVLISEEDVVTSTFNGFSENKRLVFLHETPPDQMTDLLNKVRGLITDKDIHINRKGIERYKAENFANLMAISNEDVKIDLTNRRWAVIRAADDPKGLDASGRPTPAHAEYYRRLWNVLPPDGTVTEELRRVIHYLRTFDLAAFDPLLAPITGAKEEASETGEDGGLQARVTQAKKDGTGPFRFNLLTAEDVAQHVRGTPDKRLTTAMIEVGCRKLRGENGRDVQVTIDGKRPRLWAINPTIAERHATTDPNELVRLYLAERSNAPAAEPMPEPLPEPWDVDFEPGDGDGATVH